MIIVTPCETNKVERVTTRTFIRHDFVERTNLSMPMLLLTCPADA
jgi:hypothetical protein